MNYDRTRIANLSGAQSRTAGLSPEQLPSSFRELIQLGLLDEELKFTKMGLEYARRGNLSIMFSISSNH